MSEIRSGEVSLAVDPAAGPGDAGIVFIGRVRSRHGKREDCPKNMAAARENALPASVEIAMPYREGLAGLEGFSHAIVLTWLDRSRRDLIVQKPHHANEPRGVFSLRSPVRPNPVGLHVVELQSLDMANGILHLTAIDVLDGTPVIDVKPYYASTDAIPHATRGAS